MDREHQQATCPQRHPSIRWTPARDRRKNEVITMTFSTTDCQDCPARSLCTPASRPPRRSITIRPEARSLALKQRREQEKTRDIPTMYHQRAGMEGTISPGVRTMGLRRSRSLGQEKTHTQHVATAAALNMVRRLAWFHGLPRAQTRRSHFARLSDVASKGSPVVSNLAENHSPVSQCVRNSRKASGTTSYLYCGCFSSRSWMKLSNQ